MKVWEEKVDFRTALKRDPDVEARALDAEIDACFALDYHLKHVDTISAASSGRSRLRAAASRRRCARGGRRSRGGDAPAGARP